MHSKNPKCSSCAFNSPHLPRRPHPHDLSAYPPIHMGFDAAPTFDADRKIPQFLRRHYAQLIPHATGSYEDLIQCRRQWSDVLLPSATASSIVCSYGDNRPLIPLSQHQAAQHADLLTTISCAFNWCTLCDGPTRGPLNPFFTPGPAFGCGGPDDNHQVVSVSNGTPLRAPPSSGIPFTKR